MPRKVRDSSLENRSSRSKLKARGKPYYRLIGEGLHLGYRKNEGVGKWVARRYIGNQRYEVETIAAADDVEASNHDTILTFYEAQERAREKRGYTGPYRVRDAMEAYLHDRSLDSRQRSDRLILPRLGDRLVDSLTTSELRQWHRDLVRSDGDADVIRARRATANRVLAILRAALNMAFRDGKVSSDTAWRRVKTFNNVQTARARYLSVEEAQRLLNGCEPEFRLLVRGAPETGARYSELTRLRVSDFNPDSGTVHVRQSKSGKGRHVILTENGTEFFTRLCAGRSGSAPMFGMEWGSHHQVRRMWRACERAKIEPAVGFHQLRHTWASLAVMAGMPLPVVAKNLGHVDTRMVELHYGHMAPSYVVEQVRKFAPRYGIAEVSWFSGTTGETPNKRAFSSDLLPNRYLIPGSYQNKQQNSAKFSSENL
jgi:integrase